jgi:predicted flap endonuclease-1-like 5' DNA nuclease
MTSDPTFTASFRRPGVDEPGRQITMEIGATGTRLSLDQDVLGTWSNEAIRFSPTPEPTLTIAGEAWLLDLADIEAFRAAAQERYLPGDVPPVPSQAPEVTSQAPEVTSQAPEMAPSDREPNGSGKDPVTVAHSEQSPVLPWHVLASRKRFAALGITSATALALLGVSVASGGPLAALTGFVAGGAGLTGWVAWRGIAAAQRKVRSSVGPDIDAEARVARAVAHAFSSRTVTSTLEGQAIEELTSIKGIGPQYAQLLIGVGVKSIESLAHITTNQRTELESALGRHSHRVTRERWVEQARRIIDDRDRSHTFG